MTSKFSTFLRHYRTMFFWLIVCLGLLLGNDPVIGIVAVGALITTAGLLFAPYRCESEPQLSQT